ncbi:MAG: phospholipase [Candidatus Dormibacteraeota bacterium]|uniref:phospholipase C n=1 Tax=Candidatus Amunia macphersoniae TaxID=3127014 RepID=A0A934KED8_9BACT|nr:phospholipase [Candidatus Dormibacteraeota bacterium]
MDVRPSRRQVLQTGAAFGLSAAAAAALPPGVLRALAAPPTPGKLEDIDHIIISIQENRAFDHYFGSYKGVRGFGDTSVTQPDGSSIFAQRYPGSSGNRLYPFRLNTRTSTGECTPDVDHGWPTQHATLRGRANDNWLPAHIASDGSAIGPSVMGYYNRDDLPFYYALADAFTICDHYHCSVIGPTDPNHLYNFSAWLDPAGVDGGPLLSTNLKFGGSQQFSFTWRTMPEQLEAKGITWKVYTDPTSNTINNVLAYFKAYQTNPTLAAKAFGSAYPADFAADVLAGTLPQVSWVISNAVEDEHPPDPISLGETYTSQLITALTANPAVYAKSALILTYDENGGFFDHVPPPTPDPGTPGEYVTTSVLPAAAGGVAGPIGLGYRVPTMIVSPFSRGGLVSSDVFDHTSTLLLIEKRFGVEVPNLTAYRRATVGDMTSAFNFAGPDFTVPPLPAASPVDQRLAECVPTKTYTVPTTSTLPAQEPGAPRRPSGPVQPPTNLPVSPGQVVLGGLLGTGAVIALGRLRKNEGAGAS